VDEWLPERHLARFVVEVIERLDLSLMVKAYRGSGSASYHPSVLLGLLVYGYATGVFSSRKLERATYDSVAFRFIAANDHPDHDTIATFRRRFLKEIEMLFVGVLLLAREMGMLKLGTVALDGTKVHANASRHSALSYAHAEKIEAQLKAEVAELLALAEAADQTDVPDGMSVPEELARRADRLARLAEAKAKIEARARERCAREQAEDEAKLKARAKKEKTTGKKPGGKPPAAPTAAPGAKDQVNLTDEDSRIMCRWPAAASTSATTRKPRWPRGACWWLRSTFPRPPMTSSSSNRCSEKSAPCRTNWGSPRPCWRMPAISARRMSRLARRRGSRR
jgi:transposase